MGMEMLKSMKETLMACAQGQMGHLETVDAKELGEVVDMIKDIEEAIYYCTITESMKKVEESEKNGKHTMYYGEPEYYRDQDRPRGRMYYPMYADGSSGSMSSGSSGNGSGRSYYSEDRIPYDMVMRDRREGQSPMSRRRYMEAKEMKHDKNTQLQELERYMKELSDDVVEMIEDASPEEKKYLANRISSLAQKVSKLEHDD